MKKALLYIIWLVSGFTVLAQQVSNTRFVQDGKQVKIYYDLSETADVSIYLSTDGGRSYGSSPIGHVSGHVGRQVPAGKSRCVVWDVLADRDKLQGSQVCFKIKAVRQDGKQDITIGGVSFSMVYVKGGTFTMGCTSEQGSGCWNDEKPTHSVTLNDYYIGETEVTQALWKAVMRSNPSSWKGDNLPVEGVSWEDAQTFIRKLNQMTGKTFRLPTEAEWEYAARGGNKSRGYKYSGGNDISDVAWYERNSGPNWYDGNRGAKTHAVKNKRANELGLYDMSGNVWEWCSDWYGSYESYSQTNPEGPSIGPNRVMRGGGWSFSAWDCRVSHRNLGSSVRDDSRGLRLVLLP